MSRNVLLVLLLSMAAACASQSPVTSIPAAAPEAPIVTIHLAGDSTMAEKLPEKRPETGWGEKLPVHFDPARVQVRNHAKNGRSTRTFIEEGRWQVLLDALRPGDYVFIQFGHNDGSIEKKDRYTPPADYRANLARFVTDVRARDAFPVLFTPVARRWFDGAGQLQDSHGVYPGLVRELAAAQAVPLVDMQASSAALLRQLGEQPSRALFLWVPAGDVNYPNGLQDNTHFSPKGAEVMAGLAVDGLVDLRLPLASGLVRRNESTR